MEPLREEDFNLLGKWIVIVESLNKEALRPILKLKDVGFASVVSSFLFPFYSELTNFSFHLHMIEKSHLEMATIKPLAN